jgi:hypothetical protein
MRKHQRFAWSFGLIAVMGLMAGEARATNITLTISTNGATLTITGGANALNADVSSVNSFLSSHGSAYQFSSTLGAASDWFGNSNPAIGGYLNVQGTLTEGGTGTALGAIVITANQTGFTAPPVQTAMQEGATAGFLNSTSGDSQSAFGMWNTTATTPSIVFTSPGGFDTFNNTQSPQTISGTGTYNLTETMTISLASSTSSPQDGFYGQLKVTGTAIPEPASLVMFLTAMPLPLALVGLLYLRRRRMLAHS